MEREVRAKTKTLRNARLIENKASSVSNTIDKNREGKTLKGHLKHERLPCRMPGMENSRSKHREML